MFDFSPTDPRDKARSYRELLEAADAITRGEPDAIANMANCAALIWHFIPGLNWAGFYRSVDKSLVLGPFIGMPACIRIPYGVGVCGTSAQDSATKLVADVHAFPGHIACDARSRSELVVPILRDGATLAVIDCDSPEPSFFGQQDQAGIEAMAALLADRI